MTGSLAGLYVVELANEITGPHATKLFVDLGAEVIEVAACVAVEPVIEYSMNSVVRSREGSRRRG